MNLGELINYTLKSTTEDTGPGGRPKEVYTKEEVDKLIEDVVAEFNLKLQILKDDFNHYKQEHQARKH